MSSINLFIRFTPPKKFGYK